MAQTTVFAFQLNEDQCPISDWIADLQKTNRRAFVKCLQRISDLARFGHELRRPQCDSLRNGIKELRAKIGRVNYRILYFHCGACEACLSHGLTKEGAVPDGEIDLAIKRQKLVEKDRKKHIATWSW